MVDFAPDASSEQLAFVIAKMPFSTQYTSPNAVSTPRSRRIFLPDHSPLIPTGYLPSSFRREKVSDLLCPSW